MDSCGRWFQEWAQGDPPLDDQIYSAISERYHVFLYLTGIFLDTRGKRKILSIVGLVYELVVLALYAWLAVVTALRQKDDFQSASSSWNVCIMMVFAIVFTVSMNLNRNEVIMLMRCMSLEFVKPNDYEVDEETTLAISKIKRRGKFVLTLIPINLLIGGVVIISGPVVDSIVGLPANPTYVNGIYTKLPVPLWHPFEVSSDLLHYAVLLGEAAAVSVVVIVYYGILVFVVISLQCFSIQLLILKMRIRNLHLSAYKLLVDQGGPKLAKAAMFAHHGYRKCYNKLLNGCIAHQVSILKSFNHFNDSIGILIDMAVVFCAILVAMGLLALVVGGKASAFLFGLVTVFIEISNITVLVWAADQVLELADSLPDELYGTHWPEMDSRTNKSLMVILERCKQPLSLTSFIHHTTVDWETYSSIMNSAYSYLNLIVAMR